MRNKFPLLLAALLSLCFTAAPARADDDETPPAASDDDKKANEIAPDSTPAPLPTLHGQRHRNTPQHGTSAGPASDGGGGGGARDTAVGRDNAHTPAPAAPAAPAPAAKTATDGKAPTFEENPAAFLGDRANFANGYMFVGWSPQDHPNGGAGTPKYDAYNYLVIHKIDPNDKTWAPAAAKGLNKKYPCKFWAQDGETLIYEDEYIHSAPPGHGAPGGAIPGAKGEFIWGGMNGYVPPGNPCGGPSGQVNPAR